MYPGDYVIDNRPGTNTSTQVFTDDDIVELSSSSDVTLVDDNGNVNPNNVLYKFNSVEGGVIVPRGIYRRYDLRKTKLRPLYVPDPTSGSIPKSAVFRVTGGCYFWQFSFFDGISQGVYKDPANQVHLHHQHILTTNLHVLNMLMVKIFCHLLMIQVAMHYQSVTYNYITRK